MIKISFKEQSKKEQVRLLRLLELLADPVRAQIYFEVLLRKEVTAQQLMKQLTINRSTLTHHLTKMVEAEVFEVRVQTIGRPVKYYRLNEELAQEVIMEKIEVGEDPVKNLKQRIIFMESAVAYLQVVTNIAQKVTKQLVNDLKKRAQNKERVDESAEKDFPQLVTFSFNLLADEEAIVWSKKYTQFLKEMTKELKQIKSKTGKETQPKHLVFSGIVPIVREES